MRNKEECKKFQKQNWLGHLNGDDPLMKEIIKDFIEKEYPSLLEEEASSGSLGLEK